MRFLFKHLIATGFFMAVGLFSQVSFAQYVLNGTAAQLSCNCYRLTNNAIDQSGSVWNSNLISLTDTFDFTFDIYTGDQPGGADGMAFVLQPVSTAAGTSGGGMGYQGIQPSLAVEVDTYKNNWDPTFDHVAIQKNGDVNHTTQNNLAGPQIALVSGGDMEDGNWHVMRVAWNPTTLTMDVYMDGSLRVSYTGDIVADIFLNDPMVFWGFTGSTGGLSNVHEFCLSIIPGLTANVNEICEGEEIVFDDDSYSALGSVVSWDWNFGNGETSMEETPGAIQFAQAGTYTVTQTIVDAAGCDASDSLEIEVRPNPEAAFASTEVCEGDETLFSDESAVASGTVTSWSWDFGDGTTASGNNTSTVYPSAGTYTTSLEISTNFGCVDSTTANVTVYENPIAEGNTETNSLNATFTTNLLAGEEAEWIVLDTSYIASGAFNYTFPDSGWYDITLIVTNENGCTDTVDYSIYVEGVPEYEVPNVFTPNGDEVNERFEPFTYSMVEANMQVFNRWGRPVFTYEGQIPIAEPWGWDGTINGGPDAATGTYYYVLGLKGIDGSNFSEQGTVTLVR